jgi:hypothetical protein
MLVANSLKIVTTKKLFEERKIAHFLIREDKV